MEEVEVGEWSRDGKYRKWRVEMTVGVVTDLVSHLCHDGGLGADEPDPRLHARSGEGEGQ